MFGVLHPSSKTSSQPMQIKRTSSLFEISNIPIRTQTITEADNFIHECLVREKGAVIMCIYANIVFGRVTHNLPLRKVDNPFRDLSVRVSSN